jgi:hypothetical protein
MMESIEDSRYQSAISLLVFLQALGIPSYDLTYGDIDYYIARLREKHG